jgi:N-acetylglutamate synthase-like GNAT family acetyltransferase
MQTNFIKDQKVRIIPYSREHKDIFRDLNLKWISKDYKVEEIDYKVLNDPEKFILEDGGSIILAEYDGEIVGTCALTNEGHGIYEMTKMTVDERFRGKHIGLELGNAIVENAKSLGAKKVILYSNTTHAGKAIQLYYKLGFKKDDLDNSLWERADIKMELELIS